MHHGREQGGRPQAATNTTVRCWLARGNSVAKNSALHCFLNAPADGAPSDKTCERFRLWVFFVIGKCFRPDRWAAGVPKAGRTFSGPAMQAPTSKRQGFRKNISLFCDSIVGVRIARPLRPCDPARLFGWSRALPLQWAERDAYSYKRYFVISQ